MNEANAAVAYLATDDLKELLNDDEKLEERINGVVSGNDKVMVFSQRVEHRLLFIIDSSHIA